MNEGSIDPYFNAISSPLNNPVKQSGLYFEQQYQIQATRARLSNMLGVSGTASIGFTLGAGTAISLTSQLTSKQKKNALLATAAWSVYEGTTVVGTAQIFPNLGTAQMVGNKFRVYSGNDWDQWSRQGSTETAVSSLTIYNNAGTTANLYAVVQWRFIQNNGGFQSGT